MILTAPGASPRTLDLAPQAPEAPYALLRWAVAHLPVAQGGRGDLSALIYILGVMIAVAVAGNVFRYLGETMIARSILLALMDLRERLYERTLQLPMSFFTGMATAYYLLKAREPRVRRPRPKGMVIPPPRQKRRTSSLR